MTSIDEARVREILDGCEGVTPGPWTLVGEWSDYWNEVFHLGTTSPKTAAEAAKYKANAEHLNRLDPDTMRALCTLALERLASRQAMATDEALFHALALAYGAGWDDRDCNAPRNTGRRHLERYAEIAAYRAALPSPNGSGEVSEAMVEAAWAAFYHEEHVGNRVAGMRAALEAALSASMAGPVPAGLLGRLLSQVHQVTAYHVENPPTPDHEMVQILNGELRELDDRFTAYALAAAPAPALPEAVLPCDVKLFPATTITKGCALSTLLLALQVRGMAYVQVERDGLEKAAEWHDQRARDTPDAFEMEFHQASAAALRALIAQQAKP